ncbi:MAG TPA: non-homologous end-joining DNA ligase [Opitutaceae bacterium]
MPKRKPKSANVAFSNVEKIFFPGTGFTKGEMIRYYLDVAPVLLPHLHGRPVTLIRFPDGVRGGRFYAKNAPAHAPEWIETAPVPRTEGGVVNYIVINDARTLAWCANLGAIELHPFLHRAADVRTPTHLAFDLDPGEGADLRTCIEVGFLVRELLAGLGLESFAKVSGSKGLQLYVPLNTAVTYDVATPFARAVAELLRQQHPDLIVSDMAKALRVKKVLIDWSQNHEKKTTVSVYALRGKRDQPFVSMPVAWAELQRVRKSGRVEALFFSPEAALKRIRKDGDLFAPVLKLKQKLPAAFVSAGAPSRRGRSRPGKMPGALRSYAAKRDFAKTAEPAPGKAPPARSERRKSPRFVIQKHQASRLHYDFRLEMDGSLKSWAVPKGLSTEAGVKRSGFQTEDHPLEYLTFEGVIPAGQYGGGTVMVWDLGTYELLDGDYRRGSLKLLLSGKKLKGEWHVFRIRSDEAKPVWLIQKAGKPSRPVSDRQDDRSVLSGRTMAQIAAAKDAVWQSEEAVASSPTAAPKRKGARVTAKPTRTRKAGRR